MTTELTILAAYGLMIIVLLLVQVLMVIREMGIMFVASPRDDAPKVTGVAGRMVRTVDNSIAGMALFAPAVLALHVLGVSTSGTVLATQIFIVARIAYVPIYLTGVYFVRGPTWMVGLFATGYLYWTALAS